MAKKVKTPIMVLVGNKGSGVPQPSTFRVCPLGLQFYAEKPLPEFELLKFRLAIPTSNGHRRNIRCTGVVVHCREDVQHRPCYRIWVKFLDLPEAQRGHMRCFAKDAKLLCPYCENF